MIEIKDFSAGYGRSEVLHNLNCSLSKNRIYALIGPNASGKTTLLRSIMKNIPFSKGEILLDGKNVFSMKTAEIAAVLSFSPSEVPASFDFTVAEFIGMGRFALSGSFWESPEDVRKTEESMKLMDILEISGQKMTDISTGQKQRCVLAQIIAKDTDIVLMDEATAHLDIKHRVDFFSKLAQFRRRREKTIIISFHDLNDAVNVADFFILLKNGKITGIIPSEKLSSEDLSSLYDTKILLSASSAGGRTVSAFFLHPPLEKGDKRGI